MNCQISFCSLIVDLFDESEVHWDKKVLLHEPKRHTARRVASTPYVVLTGYPPRQGTSPAGYPPRQGTPSWVPPSWVPTLAGYPPPGYPPWQGTPHLGTPLAGYPPIWTWQGTPPGCPMAFWEMLQSIMGYRYPPPPPVDRQIDGWMDGRTDACQNINFPSYYVRGR